MIHKSDFLRFWVEIYFLSYLFDCSYLNVKIHKPSHDPTVVLDSSVIGTPFIGKNSDQSVQTGSSVEFKQRPCK